MISLTMSSPTAGSKGAICSHAFQPRWSGEVFSGAACAVCTTALQVIACHLCICFLIKRLLCKGRSLSNTVRGCGKGCSSHSSPYALRSFETLAVTKSRWSLARLPFHADSIARVRFAFCARTSASSGKDRVARELDLQTCQNSTTAHPSLLLQTRLLIFHPTSVRTHHWRTALS